MKLIDKSAVVAEIERIENAWKKHCFQNPKDSAEECLECLAVYNIKTLNFIKDFLDTLEVKEVDLEDSIKETLAQKYIDYTFKRYNIDPDSKEGQLIYYAYMHGMNQCQNQLKAQKGK